MTAWSIRDATLQDAEACAKIYAPYVTGSTVSFEVQPPLAAEMTDRIVADQREHAWLVLESPSRVVGYAYDGAFRCREAYRWSCEVSVYLPPDSRGASGGRML